MSPEGFLAYLAAVAANSAYTSRFQGELVQPGLRIPMTARPKLFARAVELGRRVIWLHTFGERYCRREGRPTVGAAATAEGAGPAHPEGRRDPR